MPHTSSCPKKVLDRSAAGWSLLASMFLVAGCTSPSTHDGEVPRAAGSGAMIPDTIDDPLEPMNRGVWAFNRGVMDYVMAPLGKGYRMVTPRPVRNSLGRAGYNLGYPGRALNQLLQGRVQDAGQDTLRFATNTTAGVLGLFDVASKMDIERPDGSFSQTFQRWGWAGGDTYLMLPVIGPSDELHAVGYVGDRAADPLSYSETGRLVSYGLVFNTRADEVDDLQRLVESDPDAYASLQTIWSYQSRPDAPDWSMHGPQDPSTLETLAVASLRLQDEAFPDRAREARVWIPATGRKLPFNYWLQEGSAPVVYVIPGLGSHRLTMQVLSVAENLHRRGFAVVCISGLFHPEFIEHALTAKVPGYAPSDRADLAAALGEIDRWMTRKHGDRLGARALVGCSMGGFHTLALAAEQARGARTTAPHFERFVAVNPPVDLHYGLDRLDAFHAAPLAWPAADRQQRINNAVHKVVAMSKLPPSRGAAVPIDGIESKYLIGLIFRATLRGAIFSSQRNHDMGLLQQPLSGWRRQAVYEEIMSISFAEYFERFVVQAHRGQRADPNGFKRDGNLRDSSPELARVANAHVLTSRNDFLLSAADIAWLERTFGPQRLVMVGHGGHMGAMADPAYFDLLASRLADLRGK